MYGGVLELGYQGDQVTWPFNFSIGIRFCNTNHFKHPKHLRTYVYIMCYRLQKQRNEKYNYTYVGISCLIESQQQVPTTVMVESIGQLTQFPIWKFLVRHS